MTENLLLVRLHNVELLLYCCDTHLYDSQRLVVAMPFDVCLTEGARRALRLFAALQLNVIDARHFAAVMMYKLTAKFRL